MLFRLLVFALNAPSNNDHGELEFAKDLWDSDEPALWQKDFTGALRHWIEVGQLGAYSAAINTGFNGFAPAQQCEVRDAPLNG